MDEKKLRSFVGVCENRSITRAAEKLYTTPPALMRQIDALEEDIGARLFRRSPLGCEMTEAGRLLYERIIPVLSELQTIRREIQDLNRENNRIRICTTMTASIPLIDLFCEQMTSECPEAEIQHIPCALNTWIDRIVSQEADCALVSDDFLCKIKEKDLVYEEIGNREIICIMASKHPLSSKKAICAAELRGNNIIIDHATYTVVHSALEAVQVKTELPVEDMSPSEIYNFCQKNGIRMTSSPYGEQFRSLVSIPVTDLPPMRCGWVTRKKKSGMIKELIRISRKYNSTI